jgi:transposase
MAEKKESVTATVRTIRRATRKKYSAEEKMRIVLEGRRGETKIRELCRREGTPTNLYYRWSKEFLEAGKERLVGDTERQADKREVNAMRQEIAELKQLVAELSLKNRVLTPALPLGPASGRDTEAKGVAGADGARDNSLLGKEPPWDE